MRGTSVTLLILSILGAFLGYLRELSMAITFGAGHITDVYFVAISIPMVLGDLIIGSVLTACIVPVISELRDGSHEKEASINFLNAAILVVITLGSAIALIVSLIMPSLADFLAPGFNSILQEQLIHYTRILIWLLPINGTILLVSQVLNGRRKFILPAVTWLMINFIFFLIIMLGNAALGEECLIWAAMTGPVLMLFFSLWQLKKEGLVVVMRPKFLSPSFRSAIRLATPVILTFGIGSSLGLLMISHLILRAYGSYSIEGGISALSYAFRIYEVPISLLTSTVGVLILPIFSTLANQNNKERLISISNELMGWGFLILLPFSLLVFIFAEPLVNMLFSWGAFQKNDAYLTSQALEGFSPCILFETIFFILFRMFYGMRRPWVTVAIGMVTLLSIFIILEYIIEIYSLVNLATSLSVSFALAAILSIGLLVRTLGVSVLPPFRELVMSAVMAALGGLVFILWRNEVDIGTSERVIGAFGFIFCYITIFWKFLPERAESLKCFIKSSFNRS